jgi:hypothetical protein
MGHGAGRGMLQCRRAAPGQGPGARRVGEFGASSQHHAHPQRRPLGLWSRSSYRGRSPRAMLLQRGGRLLHSDRPRNPWPAAQLRPPRRRCGATGAGGAAPPAPAPAPRPAQGRPAPVRQRRRVEHLRPRARPQEAECFAGVVTVDNDVDPNHTVLRGARRWPVPAQGRVLEALRGGAGRGQGGPPSRPPTAAPLPAGPLTRAPAAARRRRSRGRRLCRAHPRAGVDADRARPHDLQRAHPDRRRRRVRHLLRDGCGGTGLGWRPCALHADARPPCARAWHPSAPAAAPSQAHHRPHPPRCQTCAGAS